MSSSSTGNGGGWLFGDPALRLLAGLKLRGVLRKQKRRLKTVSGALFAIIGLGFTVFWLLMVAVSWGERRTGLPHEHLVTFVGAGGLLLTVLAISGAFSHRGLYMPQEEVELLFAAPVSRSSLIRYRILSSTGRAMFGSLVMGLVAARNVPVALYGFVGAFVATLFLPLVGQAVAILLGGAENRLANRLAKLPFRGVTALGVLAVVALVFGAMLGGRLRDLAPGLDAADAGRSLLENPWLRAAAMPFRPWALMITAGSLTTFLGWLGVCALLWVVGFELVARLPVDYRELSLATSADVARRLNRYRRGSGGAAALAASKSLGWNVPWLFGRGPFGAVAWRKSGSILRKARGTLVTSGLIIGVLTLATTFLIRGSEESRIAGPMVLALAGTIYLCAGLRFDFREDLEQMEQIKAWPLKPWRLFLATLLPEVMLVSLLLTLGLGLRAAITGQAHPINLVLAIGLPFVALTWVSIDNAVFLYAPTRMTPGQDGALHNTGRAMLLMLLRLAVFLVVLLGLSLAVGVAYGAQLLVGFDDQVLGVVIGVLGMVVLMFELVGLVFLGGRALSRFDVARDRG